jgi:hypothetical protein
LQRAAHGAIAAQGNLFGAQSAPDDSKARAFAVFLQRKTTASAPQKSAKR